jgi:O-antigen/teichoic acid export membrane protein
MHEFRRLQGRLLMLSLGVAIAIAGGMYFIVPHLLVPVFGAHYAGTQTIIASMAILALLQAAEVLPGRILLAANLQIQRVAIVAVAATLCVAANFIFVPRFGHEAAVYGTASAYLLVCSSYAWLLYTRSTASTTAQPTWGAAA